MKNSKHFLMAMAAAWLATLAFSSRRKTENDMPDKPELQLITDSRNGDMEAIAELFRRHYPVSVNVARRILPARDESSDAVQSAYLSAFRNFNSFRGDSSFKTRASAGSCSSCWCHQRKNNWPGLMGTGKHMI